MKRELSEEELQKLAVMCIERDWRSFSGKEVRELISHREELEGYFRGMAKFVEITVPTIPAYQERRKALGKLPLAKLRDMALSLAEKRFLETEEEDGSRDLDIYPDSDETILREVLWEREMPNHNIH